jgi:hypothetical protein
LKSFVNVESFATKWLDILRSNPNFVVTLSQLSKLAENQQLSKKATQLLGFMEEQSKSQQQQK